MNKFLIIPVLILSIFLGSFQNLNAIDFKNQTHTTSLSSLDNSSPFHQLPNVSDDDEEDSGKLTKQQKFGRRLVYLMFMVIVMLCVDAFS